MRTQHGLVFILTGFVAAAAFLAGCGSSVSAPQATSSPATVQGVNPAPVQSFTPATVQGPSLPPTSNQTVNGQVIIEPQAGVSPYLNLINGAKHTIDVEAYLVTDADVVQALKAAASRGVKVEVIVAGDPYHDSSAVAQEQLEFSGSAVAFRLAPARFEGDWVYDHAKFLVADAGTSGGVGIIGSSNIDYSGLGDGNREYDFLTGQPSIVNALSAVFRADWTGQRAAVSVRQAIILSPGAEPAIVALISSAKQSIDIETEEFGYISGVMQALEAALKRHVAVRIVVPASISRYDAQNLKTLSQYGARIVRLSTPYPHAKLIIVDGQAAFLGSQNFSTTSLDKNREVGVELHGNTVPALESDFSADFALGQP